MRTKPRPLSDWEAERDALLKKRQQIRDRYKAELGPVNKRLRQVVNSISHHRAYELVRAARAAGLKPVERRP